MSSSISQTLGFRVAVALHDRQHALPYLVEHEVIITMVPATTGEGLVPAGFVIFAVDDPDFWDEPFAIVRPLENFFASQEDIAELVGEAIEEIEKAREESYRDAQEGHE